MDRIRLLLANRIDQHRMQIASVHQVHRRSKAYRRLGNLWIEQRPGLAGTPKPNDLVSRFDANVAHLFVQPKREQHAGAVGRELEACADLPQFRGLLIKFAIDARSQQGQGRRQPTNSGTCNENARRCLRHETNTPVVCSQ
jgi:hypothetical protein